MAGGALKPILKWVGGKRQLLDAILPLIPDHSTYAEPFVGGAAVLLAHRPDKAVVNDCNVELINVYRCVKESPDELIELLRVHEANNCSDYYYEIRALDRQEGFSSLSPVERAARVIYLNKTCFNGLYRVNSAGHFNSPYGRYKQPRIVEESAIRNLSEYFAGGVDLRCGDYAEVLSELEPGAFAYLDPPYMPVSRSASFTGYSEGGFNYMEQVRLKNECDKLRERGIRFIQSNSDCLEIRELYADYEILSVRARRAINSRADKRGEVGEVIILG